MRWIAGLILVIIILVAVGCDRGSSPGTATHVVTVPQLGAATANTHYFNYVGSDGEYHYFITPDETQYRVQLADWQTPSPLPHNGQFSLFMTVKDGKLTTPDAKLMSELMQKGLVRPPAAIGR